MKVYRTEQEMVEEFDFRQKISKEAAERWKKEHTKKETKEV